MRVQTDYCIFVGTVINLIKANKINITLPFILPAFLAKSPAQLACWKAYMPYAGDIPLTELNLQAPMSPIPTPTDW